MSEIIDIPLKAEDSQNNHHREGEGVEETPANDAKGGLHELLNEGEVDEGHYQVDTAKRLMSKRCFRRGHARYAIKRLDPNLSEVDRVRGMIDMAIEAKFLKVLWHPNLVKMRGTSAGDLLNKDSFIILDRLQETLDKRIKSWREEKKHCKGIFGFGGDKEAKQVLKLERLVVIYDLTSALAYMHQNKLVYRDIKQENIGFDVRGDVKVFDFGLTKALLPKLKVKRGYGYHLTPVTGSLPYSKSNRLTLH